MKRIFIQLLFLIALSSNAHAFENFFTNFSTLYPSGCATLLQAPVNLQGYTEQIIPAQILPMWDSDAGISVPTEVTVSRMGCADSGRSVVIIKIHIPNYADGIQSSVAAPIAAGEIDGLIYPMSLQEGPNSYLVSQIVMLEGNTYEFFLDGPMMNQNMFGFDNFMIPSQYNNEFEIHLVDPLTFDGSFHGFANTIPTYTGNLKSYSIPLNGRLTGNWVSPDASDQGFLISFNEYATTERIDSSLIFLSWYTYDQNGNMLWLTGNAFYEMGDHTVRVDINLTNNGEFLGSRKADRRVIGYVELTAYSCSELGLHYDLSGFGMGSGDLTLKRIFHLEIAGYACNDLQERIN